MVAVPPATTPAPLRQVEAVVLGGGRGGDRIAPEQDQTLKPLVRYRGRPLLEIALEALGAARGVERLLVVGPPPVLARAACLLPANRLTTLPEAGSVAENALLALDAARTPRVLFCNPDLPLLRSWMVDDFLTRALPTEADVVTGWARRESMERLPGFPDPDHKFARFGDGCYAHANLFLVRLALRERTELRRRLERLYEARKSNLRFALAMGPVLLLRYLGALLSRHPPPLAETLRRAGERFGVTLAAVHTPYPELVLDLDEAADYRALAGYEYEPAPAPHGP
jgi:molybdopterin-guanine dinucleotide biosynthesis protein A